MESYYSLAAQFRTQDEPAFCGLSTLVMVLNALEVDPKRVWKGVWRWYHEYMLDCCVPIKVRQNYGKNQVQYRWRYIMTLMITIVVVSYHSRKQ